MRAFLNSYSFAEAVPRGKFKDSLRYARTSTDGWKHVEVLDPQKGTYLHMSSVALRQRVMARSDRDWAFVDKIFLTRGTLLHLAILRESLKIVHVLLMYGADRRAQATWLWTGFVSSSGRGGFLVHEAMAGSAITMALYQPCNHTHGRTPSAIGVLVEGYDTLSLAIPMTSPRDDADGESS